MIKKIINPNGVKAFQRGGDNEDRELPYKKWLRSFKMDGFFSDIDMFKWKKVDGKLNIVAITDLTLTEKEEVSQHYLDSISYRIFIRDSQGENLLRAGELLNAPVFLVLFPKSVSWLWVLNLKNKQWTLYTPEAWQQFLHKL